MDLHLAAICRNRIHPGSVLKPFEIGALKGHIQIARGVAPYSGTARILKFSALPQVTTTKELPP